ncbi:hypothetical protein CBS101457_000243 [Exobasidium rhododendri]|nr:hypothetical protein CBS101457_000243 [Exobasidium rhododendri]
MYNAQYGAYQQPAAAAAPQDMHLPDGVTKKQRSKKMKVWETLDKAQKEKILETISIRRGITHATSIKYIVPAFTDQMALEMESDDLAIVDAAINDVFKITKRTRLPVWKEGKDERECERLVARIESMTGQPKDIVRGALLQKQVTAAMAHQMTYTSDVILGSFIPTLGLQVRQEEDNTQQQQQGVDSDEADSGTTWDAGLNRYQRGDVARIVRNRFFGHLNEALEALAQPHVHGGFGKKLLKANEAEREELLQHLYYGGGAGD